MGLNLISSCSVGSNTAPNPNPRSFNIAKLDCLGAYIYAEIHYPDCTNYEGIKVMVFEGIKMEELVNAKEIDPHFCDKHHIKPIARFEPSERGKLMAWNMINMLNQGG